MNCLSKVKNLSTQTTLFKRQNNSQEIEMFILYKKGKCIEKYSETKKRNKKKKGNQIKATTILKKPDSCSLIHVVGNASETNGAPSIHQV